MARHTTLLSESRSGVPGPTPWTIKPINLPIHESSRHEGKGAHLIVHFEGDALHAEQVQARSLQLAAAFSSSLRAWSRPLNIVQVSPDTISVFGYEQAEWKREGVRDVPRRTEPRTVLGVTSCRGIGIGIGASGSTSITFKVS